MSSDSQPLPSLKTLGPVVAGCCTQIMLYGMVCVVYWWYSRSPAGRALSRVHRGAFWVVFGRTTIQTALCIHDLAWYATTPSRDLDFLVGGTKPEAFEPIVTALTGAVTQGVLALRVSKIIENQWIRYTVIFLIGCVITLETLSGMLVSISSYYYVNLVDIAFPISFYTGLRLWMWLAAGADVCITTVYIFVIHRRLKDGNETTRSVLYLIAQGALQSASYTAVFAFISAVTSQLNIPYDLPPYAFWLELPSLYALSLVSTLSIGDRVSARMQEKTDNIIVNVTTDSQVDRNTDFQRSRSGAKSPIYSTTLSPMDWMEGSRSKSNSPRLNSNQLVA